MKDFVSFVKEFDFILRAVAEVNEQVKGVYDTAKFATSFRLLVCLFTLLPPSLFILPLLLPVTVVLSIEIHPFLSKVSLTGM